MQIVMFIRTFQTKYLGDWSFSSKVIVRTHTRPTDCSTWTIKVVDNDVASDVKVQLQPQHVATRYTRYW